MQAIVAVDKNWGIGKKNDLLFHLPVDMSFFRKTTLNKIIVMGSNTLKSFPGGNPLKNRVNIVLYPDGEKRDDCIVVNSMEELKVTLSKYPSDDIFIVGGAMFYRTMLPYCDKVYVTKVDADGQAEVFYENLDKMPNWHLVECSDAVQDGNFTLNFCIYKNDNVIDFCGGNK